MSQILKSSGAMAAATLVSRILGMVREMAYAYLLGTSWIASAFQAAFTIPNTFRRLLGEGALTAAFIPLFKETEKTKGDQEMWRVANSIISALLLATFAITVLVMLILTGVLEFGILVEKEVLILSLARWMAPYTILVCLAAVLIGMSNSRGHFFIPALSAAVLNLIMIASVYFLAPRMGASPTQQVFGLAIGVLIAGVAQASMQIPLLRREGYQWQWISPFHNEAVKTVARKMIPGTIGVAAFQINILITTLFAYFMPSADHIVASFGYAVRLMELPQGLFGISLSTFLLPTLTGLAADKKWSEFKTTLTEGIQHVISINLLASVLLTVLAAPIIRLLFERGEFDAKSTSQSEWALIFLGPGLLFFSGNNILVRAFYALGDLKTPMQISLTCLTINLLLSLWWLFPFQQGGLAMANTTTAFLNFFILAYALRIKLKQFEWKPIWMNLLKLALPALAAGLISYFGFEWIDQRWGHATLTQRILGVFGPAALAALAYFGLALLFRVKSIQEMLALVLSRGR